MAVAEASFNTEKLSMSSMFRSLMFDRSKPSTSIIASELAPKVEMPRTQKRDVLLPG